MEHFRSKLLTVENRADRERAIEMARLFEDFCGILNACQRELFANRVADALLEFAAGEVEKIKLDCTCAPFWAPYGKKDPNCEAHDLAVEVKARAEQLRAQKFSAQGELDA